MVLKDACGCASALILMFGAVTTSALAGSVRDGREWNMGQSRSHVLVRNPHHYARHNLARGLRYAAASPLAGADSPEGPHFVRVGPNGYWVTGSWGCWIDEAQDRIVDCDSANR